MRKRELCDQCGARIFWAETEQGTPIPIDYAQDERADVVLMGNVAVFASTERKSLCQSTGRRLWMPHRRVCNGQKTEAAS